MPTTVTGFKHSAASTYLCDSVRLHNNSKVNDPRVLKLGIWNDLRISYRWYDFGVERSQGHKAQKHIEGDLVAGVSRLLYISVGSYDKCVHHLRETNKDNMAAVSAAIFSHAQVAKKNVLVIAVIVSDSDDWIRVWRFSVDSTAGVWERDTIEVFPRVPNSTRP